MKKNIYTLLACLFLSLQPTQVFSQGDSTNGLVITISGDNSVIVGETRTYTASFAGGTVYAGNWSASGGTITSQTMTSATITWNSSPASILYTATSSTSGLQQAVYAVGVSTTGVPTPDPPTLISLSCTSFTLQAIGTPPIEVSWYWQGTNANGTSTRDPATSNYTRSTSGTYYLRAKNSSGVWSSYSSSLPININSSGVTWYEDSDGDGLGDPNSTLTQCAQPTNYVINDDDQCPLFYGTSNGGCPNVMLSTTENYIYNIIPQKEATDVSQLTENSDGIKNVTYFDGLGRPKQSIAIAQSASEKDIVTYIEYDQFGRQQKEYLPYASTLSGGSIISDATALSATNTYYTNIYSTDINASAPNPYSEKTFEKSPLSRVFEQAAPGDDWKKTTINVSGKAYSNGHTIKFEYDTNITSEVRAYYVTTSFANNTYTPTLQVSGTYTAGELSKTITKDENWLSTDGVNHTTEEFKNKLGQIVLKRTHDAGIEHDTYYVYDNFGNLTYVIPPKVITSNGISSTELSELCYQYKYDYRNRLVEKKIPGKGLESIVYDKLDRPIMTQDAILDSQNKWLFTKYDALGRVIYTGEFTDSRSRTSMQSHVDATNNTPAELYETKLTSSGTLGIYYSNSDFPTSVTVFTVNYYDNYTFNLAGSVSPGSIVYTYANAATQSTITSNTQGLATGSKVKVLGTSNWITTITYYDQRARPVYVYSKNDYHQTTDIVQSKLDFPGKVEQTTTTHVKGNDATLGTQTIVDTFTYDHAGRLLTQKQKINALTEEMIASNFYYELGELATKGVGHDASNPTTRLQTVDYNYNVRGWLKRINNPASLGNDLFSFKINYNTVDHNGTALFNGNIAETEWKTANTDNSLKWYKYNYDALNRITSGIDNTGNYNSTSIDYDKNGNILSLERKGLTGVDKFGNPSFGLMDNLYYNYYPDSNRLQNVQELTGGSNNYGFINGSAITTEYTYDTNGNMTVDENKGVTSIAYNHLSLPTSVSINGNGNNGTISYIYGATGIKMSKTVSGTTTNYAGNFVYVGSSLKFFNHAEGYFDVTGASSGDVTGDYVYQYKDHLGNVRLSYKDSNNNGSIVQSEILEENNYYPFGLKHKGYNNVVNGTDHKYGFGGKEEQDELGLDWMDFHARNYDPALGRWMNLDPLAEDYYEWSPYNYAFNSPMIFTDPTGLGPIYDKDGNVIGYEVEEGQGPSQIAEDLTSLGIYAEDIDFLDIVNLNKDKFTNVENKEDINDEEYTKLNLNPGEVIDAPSEKFGGNLIVTDDSDIAETTTTEGQFGDYEAYSNEEYIKGVAELGRLAAGELMPDPLETVLKGLKGKGIRSRNRSNTRSARNSGESSLSSSNSSSSSSSKPNSWNQFLKANKGKYKGEGWQTRAAADYRKLKAQ